VIAIPALDLKGGACVQVATRSYDHELIRIPDPVGVALAWRQYGFNHLHVVDLDALAGRGNNDPTIDAILGSTDAEVQVGGGIRTRDSIDQLLNEGAARVVIGAHALEDPSWLEEMASTFPGHIVAAIDVRDNKVLSHGWTAPHSRLALDVVEEIGDLPLGGLLVTIANRESTLQGRDLAFLEDVTEAIEFPLFADCSVGKVNDLRALADRGVAAAIVGINLYSGAMNPRAIADEFLE
jgi:phosphoribosylformimino-5-aminoimidazole carboxamide ribotide isomerase